MSRTAVSAEELRLDHVSVEVPDFADAVGTFDNGLGLQVSVTPQSPDSHGRIFLHRAYLEVAAHPGQATWNIGSFFLRFFDLERLRVHLDGARLEYRHRIYEGVDGRWEDVELGVADVPVPILVHRTQPATVADNWPPPLDEPHRCGAVTLAAVHLPVPSIEVAADAFRRLLAVETPPALPGPGPGQRRTAFPLGSATIMLIEGGERRAVVLGVTSLDAAKATLPSVLLLPDDDGVAWLDASATSDLRLGLIETGPWASARSRPPD